MEVAKKPKARTRVAKEVTLTDILLEIQQELKAPKNQWNAFGKYAYRNNEDILNAVKPLAHARGCIVTQYDEVVNIGAYNYVKATTMLSTVGESFGVSAYAREADALKGMTASQLTGGASSYARKYSANGLFAIDDAKDEDHSESKQLVELSSTTKNAKGESVAENAKAALAAGKLTLGGLKSKYTLTEEMIKFLTS